MEFSRYSVLLSKVAAESTRITVQNFLKEGVQPVVVKGWSIARFYDENVGRPSTDIDLAIDPADEAVARATIALGSARSLAIDLHLGLRGLDTLPWNQILEHSYIAYLDGTPIRVLADEDNLRVTAVHWLTDGGVNKERLWDIYYLVKNRKASFDWERCLESNGPIRKTWVMAAITTARDHLNLDVSGLPEEAQKFQLPDWYNRTLEKEWERGPYIRRVMSSVITKPKLLIEQLQRRFPPNQIAATIDTETPIDNSSRIPAQVKSLMNKVGPFARGIGLRLTYKRHKHDR
jgi:hypothetical protein